MELEAWVHGVEQLLEEVKQLELGVWVHGLKQVEVS